MSTVRSVSVDIKYTIVVQTVLNNEEYSIVSGCFCVIWFVCSAFGIVGNTINIRTFIAMKLEDGVTVSFLVLSISDLCFTLTMFLRACASIFYTVELALEYRIWFPVEPYAVYVFFLNSGIVMYIMTVSLTAFLAVARCMCVAKPLHFKHSFTRSRCIVILTCFAIFSIFTYVPVFANMGLFNQYDPHINATRPKLYMSKYREMVKDIIWLVRDTFLPMATQVIVIICVIIMANSLRDSNKFRQSSRVGKEVKKTQSESAKDLNKMSKKDIQVVRQVALISIVYIVCNVPKMVYNIAGMLVTEFTVDNSLHNMYWTSLSITEIFQIFNSSINVFIYYRYNSKFRSCCPIGKKE